MTQAKAIQLSGTLQIRGGTQAECVASNPILEDRELCLETDTKQFKIGDGVTHYIDLEYGGLKGEAGGIPQATFDALADIVSGNKTASDTALATLTAALNGKLDTDDLSSTVVTLNDSIEEVATAAAAATTNLRTEFVDGGAFLFKFLQRGTAAVQTTVGDKLKQFVTIEDFGASPDIADNTAAIQKALNSGNKYIRCGSVGPYAMHSVTIPDAVCLDMSNATFQRIAGGSTDAMIKLGNYSKVCNGALNGNVENLVAGISAWEKTGPKAENMAVYNIQGANLSGRGISYTLCTNERMVNCDVSNCSGQGLYTEYSTNSQIVGGSVANCFHGIQYWGGDSAEVETRGVKNLLISGVTVRNVLGGIWGSCGEKVVVVGCSVSNCTDVGIDFEGTYDSVMSSNYAEECTNGLYAMFFGCSNVIISNNTGRNVVETGSGVFCTSNGMPFSNKKITIIGNNFTVRGAGIYATANAFKSLVDSVISGNTITTENYGVLLDEARNIKIHGNTFYITTGSTGMALFGFSGGDISDNKLTALADPATGPTDNGGILLSWKGAPYPASRNTVKNNRILGFVNSINDNCYGDVAASLNWISGNMVSGTIMRRAGGSYNGVIENNRDLIMVVKTHSEY